MFVQIFASFLLGWLYDNKGVAFSQTYCLLCYIACVALLIFARGNVVVAYAFGVVFGLLASMTTVTPTYLTAKIVGVKHYGVIFGIVSLFYGLGVASGPIVIEALFQTIGWNPVWIGLAAMSAIMAVTAILSCRKGSAYALEP